MTREEAIIDLNALKFILDNDQYTDEIEEALNAAISALQQPEIVRCRECKFASGDSRICMKFGHSPIGELDFCAWAERRTDD